LFLNVLIETLQFGFHDFWRNIFMIWWSSNLDRFNKDYGIEFGCYKDLEEFKMYLKKWMGRIRMLHIFRGVSKGMFRG